MKNKILFFVLSVYAFSLYAGPKKKDIFDPNSRVEYTAEQLQAQQDTDYKMAQERKESYLSSAKDANAMYVKGTLIPGAKAPIVLKLEKNVGRVDIPSTDTSNSEIKTSTQSPNQQQSLGFVDFSPADYSGDQPNDESFQDSDTVYTDADYDEPTIWTVIYNKFFKKGEVEKSVELSDIESEVVLEQEIQIPVVQEVIEEVKPVQAVIVHKDPNNSYFIGVCVLVVMGVVCWAYKKGYFSANKEEKVKVVDENQQIKADNSACVIILK